MVGLADAGREVDLGALDDLVLRDPLVELLERDLELQAREVGAEAPVRSATEREMPVGLAIQHHLVGRLELRGVAVRGAEHQRRTVAGGHLHAVELVVLGDDARHHHHRRLVPEHLLDRGVDELGPVDDGLAAILMPREVHDHAVERGGDGVEPAEQEQVAHAELLALGERPAVDLTGRDRG